MSYSVFVDTCAQTLLSPNVCQTVHVFNYTVYSWNCSWGCLVKQRERHVQGVYQFMFLGLCQLCSLGCANYISGVVPIKFWGLCQALCSVMRCVQLFSLTNHRRSLSCVLRSDWSIRWLEKEKEENEEKNCHMLVTARRTDEGRDKNRRLADKRVIT